MITRIWIFLVVAAAFTAIVSILADQRYMWYGWKVVADYAIIAFMVLGIAGIITCALMLHWGWI